MRKSSFVSCLLLAMASMVGWLAAMGQPDSNPNSQQWPIAGQNLSDTRSQPNEQVINRSNVGTLAPKWVFTASGNVSVTPTVAGDSVYFPDWGGYVYAVDRHNGRLIWSKKVSDYDGYPGAVSRVSPAVYKDELIFGDNESYSAVHNGANVIAVDKNTGAMRWITQVDSHPAAVITGAAVVFGDVVYQGLSSAEEGLADQSGYPCCTFRGSMVALDAKTGRILWQTFDMPANGGNPDAYSGGAIWQSPAIDPERGLLYVGTGNNYTVPQSVEDCQALDPTSDVCPASNDYFDTALALDLKTGAIKWSKRLYGYDAWTVACLFPRPGTTCPSPHGPDYDLGGSGPNLVGESMVGFGQKSGMYWGLNRDNGNILWAALPGPGGTLGGIEWGSATDGRRIYVAIGNSGHTSYTLTSGQLITWGSWSALDAATGKILWQTADPTEGALDTGSVSVANGVLYAGSYDASGHMYAFDADTGKILWSFASGGSVIDGPSIVDGFLYWGSGYSRIRPGTANNKVYAFAPANREPQGGR